MRSTAGTVTIERRERPVSLASTGRNRAMIKVPFGSEPKGVGPRPHALFVEIGRFSKEAGQ